MDECTISNEIDDKIYCYARDLTIGEIPKAGIIQLLLEKGLNEKEVRQLMAEVEKDLFEEKKTKALIKIITGGLLLLLGLGVTFLSIYYVDQVGYYVVALGVIAAGFARLLQGIFQYYSKSPL